MRPLPTLLALLLGAAPLAAQDKAPANIDQTIDRIAELRARRAELDKLEAAAVGDLKAQLKALNDKIDKLGLSGPAPVPPPPVPVDLLRGRLRDALKAAAGDDAKKREWAKDLAALYRAAAKLTADPEVATAAALSQRLKDAAKALVGADTLIEVRRVVSAELGAVLPTADADLTDTQRAAASALFAKLATHLDALAAE